MHYVTLCVGVIKSVEIRSLLRIATKMSLIANLFCKVYKLFHNIQFYKIAQWVLQQKQLSKLQNTDYLHLKEPVASTICTTQGIETLIQK